MRGTIAAFIILAAAGTAAAQTGVLYVTSGNSGDPPRIISIQGGSLVNNVDVSAYTNGQGPGGITVYGDVRVVGQFGAGGVQTDLALNITGPTFGGLPFGDSYDGTTDGNFNYITDFASGDVYRTNRDYTGATQIFNTGQVQTIGITYNPYNGLLYTHATGAFNIRSWDTAGNPMGDIAISFGDNWRGLAFDPADSTFWLTEHSPVSGNIRQVDLAGNTIQTLNIPGLAGLSPNSGPLGAEFNLVPAPGAAALLGVSGLVAARRRRA